jgi:hypothetical protein
MMRLGDLQDHSDDNEPVNKTNITINRISLYPNMEALCQHTKYSTKQYLTSKLHEQIIITGT